MAKKNTAQPAVALAAVNGSIVTRQTMAELESNLVRDSFQQVLEADQEAAGARLAVTVALIKYRAQAIKEGEQLAQKYVVERVSHSQGSVSKIFSMVNSMLGLGKHPVGDKTFAQVLQEANRLQAGKVALTDLMSKYYPKASSSNKSVNTIKMTDSGLPKDAFKKDTAMHVAVLGNRMAPAAVTGKMLVGIMGQAVDMAEKGTLAMTKKQAAKVAKLARKLDSLINHESKPKAAATAKSA